MIDDGIPMGTFAKLMGQPCWKIRRRIESIDRGRDEPEKLAYFGLGPKAMRRRWYVRQCAIEFFVGRYGSRADVERLRESLRDDES